ncbi:hypothetical protein CCHR01_19932, partial [Colletotrichum chrysophilum]
AQPTAAGSTTPRETGTPDADDVPAAQHALLAAAHDAERAHLAGGLRVTASATGPVDIAFQTGWMRRTGWDLMFDGARRDFLVKMSELPTAGRDVQDVDEDDMPHSSPPEDEARLRRIVSAVDGVFNRCEDTIRSMDVSCRRSLTIAQSRALDALWSDELWNTSRLDDATAATGPTRSGAVSPHGEATDVDERRMLRTTTRTRARGIPSHRSSSFLAGGDLSDDSSNSSATETDDDESDFEDLLSEGLEGLEDFGHEDTNASSHTDTTEDSLTANSKSTLLVYFGGVLGLASDGSGFRRPGNYTASLLAFIYYAHLVVVEVLLPRTSHDYVSYPARPRSGQLDILNRVHRETMCLGSQAPIGEFLSLRAYGRALATADGPSFRFD